MSIENVSRARIAVKKPLYCHSNNAKIRYIGGFGIHHHANHHERLFEGRNELCKCGFLLNLAQSFTVGEKDNHGTSGEGKKAMWE